MPFPILLLSTRSVFCQNCQFFSVHQTLYNNKLLRLECYYQTTAGPLYVQCHAGFSFLWMKCLTARSLIAVNLNCYVDQSTGASVRPWTADRGTTSVLGERQARSDGRSSMAVCRHASSSQSIHAHTALVMLLLLLLLLHTYSACRVASVFCSQLCSPTPCSTEQSPTAIRMVLALDRSLCHLNRFVCPFEQ